MNYRERYVKSMRLVCVDIKGTIWKSIVPRITGPDVYRVACLHLGNSLSIVALQNHKSGPDRWLTIEMKTIEADKVKAIELVQAL